MNTDILERGLWTDVATDDPVSGELSRAPLGDTDGALPFKRADVEAES